MPVLNQVQVRGSIQESELVTDQVKKILCVLLRPAPESVLLNLLSEAMLGNLCELMRPQE
jgi:hypothetical protein